MISSYAQLQFENIDPLSSGTMPRAVAEGVHLLPQVVAALGPGGLGGEGARRGVHLPRDAPHIRSPEARHGGGQPAGPDSPGVRGSDGWPII